MTRAKSYPTKTHRRVLEAASRRQGLIALPLPDGVHGAGGNCAGKQACSDSLGLNDQEGNLSNSTAGCISIAPCFGVVRQCEKGEGE